MLSKSCYNGSVSELLGQPCNKSDFPVKLVTSCQRTIYNVSGRVVSAYTNTSRRRELYIWYNTDANVVNGL